jgi:hypothetical protein
MNKQEKLRSLAELGQDCWFGSDVYEGRKERERESLLEEAIDFGLLARKLSTPLSFSLFLLRSEVSV